jgi:hypothetical protein
MDKSLTLLAILMGVSLADVMMGAKSKIAGEYVLSRFGETKGTCVKLVKGKASPGLEKFFESKVWLYHNYLDYVLYAGANASLDRTIDSVGREHFQAQLAEFQRLRELVETKCGNRIGSGCDKDGRKMLPVESCYDRDFGCGYKCVDDVLQTR